MKIAITGTSGFIGSHLLTRLSKDKDKDISVFDTKKYSLQSTDSLKKFVEKKDVIIHLAGVTNTENAEEYYTINTLGTLRILEAITCFGKPRAQFIFASSFAVYQGNKTNMLLNEESLISPRNHYGLSKFLAEELATFYSRKHALQTRILRISNPYGPKNGKMHYGIIAILIDKIKNGEEITINGDGTQSRDFIFIQDVINAFVNTLDYRGNSLLVNVCSGKETRIIDLVRKIESLLGKKAILTFNKKCKELGSWIGDPQKAVEEIDFQTAIDIDEGLKQTVRIQL